MCGRFALWSTEKIESRFQTTNKLTGFISSYNVSPGSITPIIIKNSPKQIKLMKWGMGDLIINARAEGIEEKYIFRDSISDRRCLVPVNGFYEWKRLNIEGKDEKMPWFIGLKGQTLFSLAGIYDTHNSYVIITTAPNKLLSQIHNRMPVILNRNDEDKWLDRSLSISKALNFLKPYPEKGMVGYSVSKQINNPGNNFPSLVKEVK